MSEYYQVVFTGNLQPGQDVVQVIDRFSEKAKLERGKAELLIHSGRPIILKKGLDRATSEKYLMVLRQIGLVVELVPKPPAAAPVEPKAPPAEPKATVAPPIVPEAHEAPPAELKASEVTPIPPEASEPPPVVPKASNSLNVESLYHGGEDTTEILDPNEGPSHCPKCGSNSMEMGICQACGIVATKYLAARTRQAASVQDEAYEEEDSTNPYTAPESDLFESQAGEMSGPRAVSSGRGMAWLGQGWGFFSASPLAWILAMVAWFVISSVVGMIPFGIGGLILILAGPVIMAGFVLGCREQEEGGDFAVSHLYAGFSLHAGQLLLVGLLYLAMMIVVGLIVGIGLFFSMGGMSMIGDGFNLGFILLLILAFFLSIAVMMSYLFAPALIVMNDLNALEAMKLSFKGCLINLLPLLLYALAAVVLMMLGAIPFGLGLLVVLPMLIASNYAAYRDIYYE